MAGESVVDIFETACRSHPSSPALVLESGESCSYRELEARAAALATNIASWLHPRLDEIPVTETPLVAVMMHRHVALVASLLAVLKCGAAYVPVDPSFPPERQAYIFNQSRSMLLVTDEACFETAKHLGVAMPFTIVVSSNTAQVVAPAAQPASATSLAQMRSLLKHREGGGLMYVLYTSGSTGKPKGVMVMSSGVLNTVEWFVRELQIGSGSRVLGLTTTCFDISMLEIFMPLVSGGTLVLASSATQKNPFRLLDLLSEQGKPYGFILVGSSGGENPTNRESPQTLEVRPRLVYRVDAATGARTLVRGVKLVGTPLVILNRIVAAGDDDTLADGFVCGAESGWVPVSQIAPSLLVSEIELQRLPEDRLLPPILPSPLHDRR